MPILREVVTRFKFETDKKGADKVNRNVERMKGGVRGLAKLFGVGLGIGAVRSLFKLGTSLEQARFNLQRFSGIKTDKLATNFISIQKSLNTIRAGAGDALRLKDFFNSGALFFQTFGQGEEQTKDFLKTFTIAAKLSKITGNNVNEMFQAITKGVEGGDFSFLAGIEGFSKERIQTITDLLEPITNIGEIGGNIGRQAKLQKFLEQASLASRSLNQDLRDLPEVMLEADRTTNQLAEIMDKVAKIVADSLVPVLKELANGISVINKAFGLTGTLDAAKKKRAEELPDLSLEQLRERLRSDPSLKGRPTRKTVLNEFNKDSLARTKAALTIENTITINGVLDPEVVGNIVVNKIGETVRNASNATPQTEER